MSLYLIAGVAGVPLFAEGESGWGGPSFGYIIGFLVAGGVVGYLAARERDRSPWQALPVMLLGSGIIYVFGVPWLMAAMQLDPQEAIELGVKPFVGGDLIKVAVAATVLPAAWRLARRWD
jgi:biotin transport system substrate-specific component